MENSTQTLMLWPANQEQVGCLQQPQRQRCGLDFKKTHQSSSHLPRFLCNAPFSFAGGRTPAKTRSWACSSPSVTPALEHVAGSTEELKHQQDTTESSQKPLGWHVSTLLSKAVTTMYFETTMLNLLKENSKLALKMIRGFLLWGLIFQIQQTDPRSTVPSASSILK